MKKNDYRYDHETNTLTITKAFKAAASKVGSSEYGIILQLRRDNPDMKIELMNDAPKKNSAPKLTFEKMKNFISQCRDADARMAVYERVFALSKSQRSPYHYVKAWFLDNYANYSEKPEFGDDGFVIAKTKAEMEMVKKEAASIPSKNAEET